MILGVMGEILETRCRFNRKLPSEIERKICRNNCRYYENKRCRLE